MITRITFDHFWNETKQHLPKYLIEMINPLDNVFYYKINRTYLIITNKAPDTVEVNMAVSTGKSQWLLEFVREMKYLGYKHITFATTPDNKVNRIIKYYHCKLVYTRKDYFGKDKDLLFYTFDFDNYRTQEGTC